jgi:hypothetical protein
MEAAGHPVSSAARHQMKDGYLTTLNGSNVPRAALARPWEGKPSNADPPQTFSRSTSKISVALGGITPPAPRGP